MTYDEQEWSNNPANDTPISEERLRHIEEGIGNAHDIASDAWDKADAKGRAQDEGADLPARDKTNYVGPGVLVTDSPTATRVEVPGTRVEAADALALAGVTTLNFGTGLLAYADGANRVTVEATDTGGGGGSGGVGTALPAFFHTGPLTVLDGDGWRFYNDSDQTWVITAVRAGVRVPPTGADLVLDLNIDGDSVFYADPSDRPRVPASGRTSGKVLVPNTAVVEPGHFVTVDIDQVGSTNPGESLQVQIQVA